MRPQSHVQPAEMAYFCRQFGTMLAADVNLLPVIATLRQQTANEYLREVLLGVQEDLEMGVSLAVAFSRYPGEFSPFFIQLIRQGEIEGALPDVLQRLADHYEAEARGSLAGEASQVMVNIDMGTTVEALRPLLVGLLLAFALVAFAVAGVLYATTVGLASDTHIAPNIALTVCLSVLLAVALVQRFRPRQVRRCSFCGKLDTETEEILVSRGVAICSQCVVDMVQRMRKVVVPPHEPAATPAGTERDAETQRRIAAADKTAFHDPQEPIDLFNGSASDGSTSDWDVNC